MLLTSGTDRQRSKGPTRPERLCVFYDERSFRLDCLPAAIEQRFITRQMAIWYQDKHHI